MQEVGRQNKSPIKKAIVNFAKNQAQKHHEEKRKGNGKETLRYKIAKKLVLR